MDHRQPVHLPDCLPVGVDEDNPLLDRLHVAFRSPIQPIGALIYGPAHVIGEDEFMIGAAGPEGSLAHQIGHVGKAGGDLLLVAGQARRLVDDPGHRRWRKVTQPLFPADVSHESGIIKTALPVPGHGRGELGLHLEQLTKVLVQGKEKLVQPCVANDYHLDVERNRFRLQSGRGHEAVELGHLLDLDFPIAQGPFQSVPGRWVGQQILGLHDEVAAIGAVQRPSPYLGEIGHHGSQDGAMLDPPHQVLICGIVLDDDRGAHTVTLLGQHVDLVAIRLPFSPRRGHGERRLLLLRGAHKVGRMLHNVAAHGVQIGRHLGTVAVARLDILQQLVRHESGQLLSDVVDGLLACPVQFSRLAHRPVVLLLELRARGL